MSIKSLFQFLFVFTISSVWGDDELPEWKSAPGKSSGYPLGGGLWPDSALPRESEIVAKAKARARELANFRKKNRAPKVEMIPEYSMQLSDINSGRSNYRNLPEIEGQLYDDFFGERPTEYLIDPQLLLAEQKANDLLRFLEFHSEDSRFEIYTFVLGNQQEIPAQVNLTAIHKEWFGDRPSVLMIYQWERPETVQLIYSNDVIEKLPKEALAKVQHHCVSIASRSDRAADQLEKLTIELSIQLFWVEQMLNRPAPPTPDPAPAPDPVELTGVIAEEPPLEMIPPPPHSGEGMEDSMVREEMDPELTDQSDTIHRGISAKHILTGSLLLLFASLSMFLKMIFSKRIKIARDPILFPNYTKEPRLGGEFSGGAFVGISFDL